jgi:hypothetical protein
LIGIPHSKLATSRIGGVMVSVIASSVVVRVFEPRSGQTKDYKVSICCFSTQHAVFKEKEKKLVGSESKQCVRVGLLFQ